MSRLMSDRNQPAGAKEEKAPQRRGVRAVRAVASRLLYLGLVSAVTLTAGCLIPQEDEILEPIYVKNRPPRLIEQNITPQRDLLTGVDCVLPFEVPVEDPDVDDFLTYRYYVDYDLNRGAPDFEAVIPPDGQVIRKNSAVATSTNDLDKTALNQPGDHVVTVMVFDGTLGSFEGPGESPDPVAIPGSDGGFDPRYSVSYNWIIRVDPQVSCPPMVTTP